MKLPVHDINGKELRTLEVDDSVFGIEPNGAVVHQAFVTQRNNQRWGTAQTKTRGQVAGSTRKIRRQKYTGAARQGGNRSPTRVGGGTAFGPVQRDYSQALNKKMRRLAIRSVLSGKAADGELVVIDQLVFKTPKTKEIIRVLRNVGIERSALIVTAQPERAVLTSARNLQKTKVLPAAYLNVLDMLNHRSLLMTEEAVRVAEGLWGRRQAAIAPSVAPAPTRGRASKAPVAKVAPTPEAAAAAKPKAAVKPRATVTPKAATNPKTTATPKATTEKASPRRTATKKPEAEATKPRPRRAKKAEMREN